ncbi:MAG: ATP-dependent zinc metalloprotease FtsH [Bacteroidetes bacterium]|nr:ATP-dependent zinc metalloprotease FtsH [Bacteroidota bacterium]
MRPDNRDQNPETDRPERLDRSPRRRGRYMWIYVVLLGFLLVNILFSFGRQGPEAIPYSTFLEYVEQGYVEKVTIQNDRQVTGTLRESGVQALGREVETDRGFLSSPEDPTSFLTTKTANHDLIAFLEEQRASQEEGQVLSYEVRYQDNWFGGALAWLLPLAIILALWIFILRRAGPGSQVLNIGKNRAVLFESLGQPTVTFEDVAGLAEAKEEVAEVVEFLKTPKKFTKLGGVLPKGVLLVGPPGTGKTLMGKAVAGEARVPFFSISGSDFVEMFVGVGAARVRDLFKKAKEKAPCIVFIDEIDAIGRSRGRSMMMGGNDERENTLNQLLVEMDGFNTDKGVIIMAATNRPDVLDAALLRPGRFDRQILIDRPDRLERAMIFRVHTRDLVLAEDVEPETLASQTPGFAGAEIANVCNEAALLAARFDKEAIEMTDFEQAIDRVIGGLEKKNKLIKPEEKKIVAYHEAGHAIAGWYLPNTDPVIKVSIVPRGLAALGYAQSLPDERYITTREAFMDQMTMMMGGRVAEEIKFGQLSTGAQNDLERITKTAYAMVVDFGMSAKVGHVSFNMTRRRDGTPMFEKPYSETMASMIDQEVRELIEDIRQRAWNLLSEKGDRLEELAQLLLEKEVLGPRDLVGVLGERPFGEYVSLNGIPESKETPESKEAEKESAEEREGAEVST